MVVLVVEFIDYINDRKSTITNNKTKQKTIGFRCSTSTLITELVLTWQKDCDK